MNDVITKQVSGSTNILNLSYTRSTRKLVITFSTGHKYEYQDVPYDVFEALNLASSTGKAFFALIKGRYEFTKLV